MRVLGISAFYHDSAAAIVIDGNIVAAAQQERFSRIRHDAGFPRQAIVACLKQAGLTANQIDLVVFYDKPFLKFERLLETYLAFAPRGFRSFSMAIPIWLKEKLFQKWLLKEEMGHLDPDGDWEQRLLFAEHHQSHAASAFYPSPFDEAVILTLDGVGEWATTSLSIGRGRTMAMEREIHFPHSLGLLYSAFTQYLGFKVNSGEYKVMGLAPYGQPKYRSLILDRLIDVKPDGSFHLELDYFDYCTGLNMINRRFADLFGAPPRAPESPLTSFHMDVAASIQAVVDEIMLRLTRDAAQRTGLRNLCLAGGVALNCVANGKVLRDGKFDRIWIQPASGDAGGAIGAALAAYHLECEQPRVRYNGLDGMQGSLLGPEYPQSEIETRLATAGATFDVLPEQDLMRCTVDALVEQKAVGWFQGRMEFGPRALGARSILGDPRSPEMQRNLNLKVKYRESFRPFAPSVLAEEASDWFEIDRESPYMLLVADVARSRRRETSAEVDGREGIDLLNIPRSTIPAVTHVDNSARLQTVHRETNPRYYDLLRAFKKRTGCPVLVNTSFNVRGEPIVCTPEDAFRCFMGTEIEALVIGNCFLRKERQDPSLKRDYKSEFDPD